MKNVKLGLKGNSKGGFSNEGLVIKIILLKDFVVNFNMNCKLITQYSNKIRFKVTDIEKAIQEGKENRI